ncbi:hypothetical protein Q5O02_04895 [Bacillus stercoris]|uniref:hypothetical protein n=1 Tax=Bacillus stercoris TaxID=2054641 RepID=UPI000D401C4E|nr:hypothetical protein [Bacillus stercoris]MDO7345479.1 hypothetical protein [Bacillus stercoris]PTU26556.1 hypothetical protein DA469_17525 [Bacillus subtilis]
MNLIRNILIVDDSLNLELDITQYDGIFKRIKRDLFLDYEINFFNERKYDKAIELLNSTDHTFDVLLIDYDLSSAGNEKSGIDLVKEIRNGINRHCKIIFYTMHELSTVFPNRKELVLLFNQGIFKFLSKDMESQSEKEYGQRSHQLRVESMIEAINNIDFIQVALERYFLQYKEIIDDERIVVDGKEFKVEDIITLIRQDNITGKHYKSNLAESVIIHNLLAGGQ